MESDSLNVPNEHPDDFLVKQRRCYPCWVGLIFAFLLPGTAHVLSGRIFQGVLWLLVSILIGCGFLGALILPGKWFYCGVFATLALFAAYVIALLISSWRPTRRIGWFGWGLFFFLLIMLNVFVQPSCLQLYKRHVAELFSVKGMSMAPTLIASSQQLPSPNQADYIVVNKRTYRFANPDRGDIVVYRSDHVIDGNPVIFVHRIVGLPGETIDIDSPYVLVNSERLTDPPFFEKMASRRDGFSGYFSAKDIRLLGIEFPVTLGENEYFLLGDNSEFSADSRMYGPVKRSDILGRVTHIYYPFSRIGEPE